MGTQETIEVLCEVNKTLLNVVKQQSDLLELHGIESTMNELYCIDEMERVKELI